ncbi:MAG TPA: protein-glutamate O-methyltransferase [Spirochaetota bacterium]|nr:protein-glutamate O-methyltransferase [Spirochaetota bacterium]
MQGVIEVDRGSDRVKAACLLPAGDEMPDHLFEKFSSMIYRECGIHLPRHKKIMLAARLNKRVRALGLDSYDAYHEYVSSEGRTGAEFVRMIDAVSTNKTEFFRERAQFDFLTGEALPALVASPAYSPGAGISLWSAGCSSGEEAYTLAMLCAEFFSTARGAFSILATDISTRVLDRAQQAIYPDRELEGMDPALMRKYFMKGKGDHAGSHRVVPELRARVQVRRHNLVNGDYAALPMMHVIFCRNVVIYFDRETQNEIFRRLADRLAPGGYLFIGHSETIMNLRADLDRVGPTTYRKGR